ncbi:MAG: hypothetical protein QM747_04005 [Nocardioides sp.]
MTKHSGTRAALLAVVVGLACTACSVSFTAGTTPAAPQTSTSQTSTSPAKQAQRRLPRLLAAPPSTEQAAVPAHPTVAQKAMISGLNAYCRRWYVAQRAASIKFPDADQQWRFARLQLPRDQVLLSHLKALRPTPAAARVLHAWIGAEEFILSATKMETSQDSMTSEQGADEVLEGIDARHEDAGYLGARECDGQLPHQQAVAAERATQRFALARTVDQACRATVTPSFLRTEWGGQSRSPLEMCRRNLRIHRRDGIPRNIRVTSVTGVENLTATVTFNEVPECGCDGIVARLFREHGRWLVASMPNHK